MKIYFFKDNPGIDGEVLKKVAIHVGHILGVDYHVEEKPVEGANSLEELQSIANHYLQEKRRPLIGAFYTLNNVEKKASALGVASYRVALIRYNSRDFRKLVLTTLHETGHLCDAGHCGNKHCLMYPQYQPLPVDNIIFRELVCSKCFAVISHSWVYKLLTKGSKKSCQVRSTQ